MANESIFGHLSFARNATLRLVKDVSENKSREIPEGFSNNILWNLGHIYSSLESFAFGYIGESMDLPEEFKGLFGMGSKPSEWSGNIPEITKLIEMLEAQPQRVQERLADKLDQEVKLPFTIPGAELKTVRDLLTFSFYHEAGHTQTIKHLKKSIIK